MLAKDFHRCFNYLIEDLFSDPDSPPVLKILDPEFKAFILENNKFSECIQLKNGNLALKMSTYIRYFTEWKLLPHVTEGLNKKGTD